MLNKWINLAYLATNVLQIHLHYRQKFGGGVGGHFQFGVTVGGQFHEVISTTHKILFGQITVINIQG